MILVFVWMMTYLWFDINLLEKWFGFDVDVLQWGVPAILAAGSIVFIGFGIAAFRQKCWGELAIAAILLIFTLINMSNFWVNL